MPGKVNFEYDPIHNIVFTDDTWEIKSIQDVDDFFALYYDYFGRLGKKIYMISHIDNLLVRGEVSDYYAEKARDITAKFLLGFARWGTNSWARMTVRTTALKANMAPQIFATRAEAIAAITAQSAKQ
jgi:hypothetical protein